MRYFIDTEFIEYPCTIDLISIGIIGEDGQGYYAENSECDFSKQDEWGKKNVTPFLVGGDYKSLKVLSPEKLLSSAINLSSGATMLTTIGLFFVGYSEK